MRAREFLREAAAEITSPRVGSFSVEVPTSIRGPDVADLQKALITLGYSLPRFGVDGIRGPETNSAIKKFQQDYGIADTGNPDAGTVDKINAEIAKNPKAAQLKKSTAADVKTRTTAALPTISQDAATTGKVGQVLNLVAGPESRGFYDMMFGGKRHPDILKMTIADANKFQTDWGKQAGSSAMGRYQIMAANTIDYARKAGLNPATDLFDPVNQDKMGIVFLQEKGLDRWLAGQMTDEQFLDGLSRVWAGVPSPSKNGASYYGSVGLNRSQTQLSMDTALASLKNIKEPTAAA